MKQRLTIVIGGYIGLYPTGGVTWDYIQYPLGLRMMGHDVYYIEDTVQYSRYQKGSRSWDDASDSILYLKETMEAFGFKDRWAYRDVSSGECFGMSLTRVRQVCASADLFINISASTFMRDEYLKIPVRLFIDSDPMFTQIDYYNECYVKESTNEYRMKFVVENHTHHASFGENMGALDCRIPSCGINWQPTRQPVCLEYWKATDPSLSRDVFTTVMNWSAKEDLTYDQKKWGQKDKEFEKIIELPTQFCFSDLEIMLAGAGEEKIQQLKRNGWKVLDALTLMNDVISYQEYITSSLGEFSVAKETYVKARSGWFSCRSACYLAAGKPVVTQETGWSRYIPSGLGLFAFDGVNTALHALNSVRSDVKKHSIAARQIAEEYFDSFKVLGGLLEYVGHKK